MKPGDLVCKKSGKPFKNGQKVSVIHSFGINEMDLKKRPCVFFEDASCCNIDLLIPFEESIYDEVQSKFGTTLKKLEDHSLIYVASPYNHEDPAIVDLNYAKAAMYTAKLIANGNIAISPIAYGHNLLKYGNMPGSWEFWKNFCISFLSKCNTIHVLMMDGWEDSKGVQEEIKWAKENGLTIQYIENVSN